VYFSAKSWFFKNKRFLFYAELSFIKCTGPFVLREDSRNLQMEWRKTQVF